jgi:hypothetical protein
VPGLNLFLLLLLVVTQECAASGYGLLSATHGVLVVTAGLVAIALFGACHALARVKGPRGDRVVIDTRVATTSNALVVVLLALVFIEDPVDWVEHLPFVRTHTVTAYWVLGGIALTLTGGLAMLLRALPSRPVGGFLTFALAGALAVATAEAALEPGSTRDLPGPKGQAQAATPDLPNVYYIVLDGHSALRAFPPATPGAGSLFQRIRDDYRRVGLELHEGAYSRFQWTDRSLYTTLDNALHPDALEEQDHRLVLPSNTLFDHMISQGYRPRIHHSDYFDLCEAALEGAPHCERYRVNNLDHAMPAAQKYPLLLASLLHRVAGGAPLAQKKRAFGVINSVHAFERLIDAVPEHPRGQFVFAHFLLPHEPYVLDESCNFDSAAIWRKRFQEHYSLIHPSEAARHRAQYVPQVGCTHSLLMKLVGALVRAGRLEESTIIVHGDHGSRIRTNLTSGREAPGDALGLRTRLDFLATHFAVKPGAFPLEPARYAGRKRWETLDNLLAERMGWPKLPVRPPAERPAARR